MSILEILNMSHSYGDKVLYRNAEFALFKGEHMGVVGQNGAGKSTLIGILTGEIIPDEGEIHWQKKVQIGYLDQYAVVDQAMILQEYLKTAFSKWYELEKQVHLLYDQYAQTEDESLLAQAAEGQNRLEENDFYHVDTRINQVADGLGLTAIGLGRPLAELSGGQRAKVILAKLLLEQPDVLLLDEPTNFLDKEHIDWLVEYLSGFRNAFIVVSHDFTFLDRVSTCILDVEAGMVNKYHGKYTEFLKQKEHLREDHIRRYQSQQMMIKRTEEFIRKNIAGVNSKNAKGRRKQLERLERVAPPTFTLRPTIRFQEQSSISQKALEVEALRIGYDKPLLPDLNFLVRGGEKLVITGFNGIGKSTLLKTLVGERKALSGRFRFADQTRIGYYEQDLCWEDPHATPIQIIAQTVPNMPEKQIRKQLAACGVRKDSVLQDISTLSGGEQSKVKLCRLLLFPYHILILDEPTNHLDAETKEELHRALVQFKGSIILVSHEESFYRTIADRILPIQSM